MQTFIDTVTQQVWQFEDDVADIHAYKSTPSTLVPYTIPAPTEADLARIAHNILVGEALNALGITDKVSYRCFKAGIVYPADWQTYTLALRSIVNESDMSSTTLPIPPSYPLGT
jgi:hypothetical protein